MKNKIKIVYVPGKIASLNTDWIRPLIEDIIEFEVYNPAVKYPAGTLFYLKDTLVRAKEMNHYRDLGFRILFDNLWEQSTGPVPNAFVMHNSAWFWYNEALWYQHRGYTEYVPKRTYQWLALMPMNLRRQHRTLLKEKLGSTLDRMLWSYVAEGRQLPNDGDMTVRDTQRYINPEWFDQTYCSLVAETNMKPGEFQSVFITEKTFKPMAFKHPFLICGHAHSLRTLREQGFVTWNNLWDESYDEIADWRLRLDAVVHTVKNIEIVPHSAETLEKLQHNFNHFFDFDLIRKRITTEILNPLIEYAQA